MENGGGDFLPWKSGRNFCSSFALLQSNSKETRVDQQIEMTELNDEEIMKILPPASVYQTNGECTVLVQIDPEDSSTLDFTGATGAIGRMEADDLGGTSNVVERLVRIL